MKVLMKTAILAGAVSALAFAAAALTGQAPKTLPHWLR